ncbi:hypothetical protein A2833_01975 [Candidatus Azambacteria bacterium RIFCSPHIGHO2_01_FULL_44_55]|uniref:dTDP-4-dehydrorhamnose 3,5-epimerase n=1 Tax=Candidatus Azambacteria bacterium RIFCSPLOWO2_02_FULL_44_14 TaxID=1797306 RepID=A0A1F5CD30_9BACT|nr:MAG: hypothetical protein A3C78_02210 [Candidatus Azambacteria bacterium RIFCSPHIGHO2_02_FULL_45_18]OGD40452.1 MAG: hypothetical protein A2833_01975 [Candidatus Azambacteria bacterium RIFCSPHIGHO2_01_FULL_44_55]OGD40771.1 MAG: hypothetical protein A3I30_01720 [Candidatus Azambacteria bacterium RIFCSPLOWO2_02_FULL_44_14]OGD52301.1 MAG: hypothetical protein A2608_01445 [Candidatus Azambacteria bacterium RIFOXYD1_FULL_44_10]
MIGGVKIKKITTHRDDRGFFAEMVKFGEDTFHEVKQTSYAETKPGIIKAFHLHDYWESWCIVKGSAKIVLADIRADSPTKGKNDVLYVDEKDLVVIAIPPGVAHGYQVLSDKPMGIIYHAEEAYDPENLAIKVIPHDCPEINFDWDEIISKPHIRL